MICFQGKQFCHYYNKCAKQPCPDNRELTPQVKKDAEAWWGGPDAPIAQFACKPECFKEIEE